MEGLVSPSMFSDDLELPEFRIGRTQSFDVHTRQKLLDDIPSQPALSSCKQIFASSDSAINEKNERRQHLHPLPLN